MKKWLVFMLFATGSVSAQQAAPPVFRVERAR